MPDLGTNLSLQLERLQPCWLHVCARGLSGLSIGVHHLLRLLGLLIPLPLRLHANLLMCLLKPVLLSWCRPCKRPSTNYAARHQA